MRKKQLHQATSRRIELLQLIAQVEQRKKHARLIIRRLSHEYKSSRISHTEYKEKVQQVFGQQRPLHVFQEYDFNLKRYKRELREHETRIQQITRNAVNHWIIVVMLIALASVFITQPLWTGFSTVSGKAYVAEVNVVAEEDTTYELTLPAQGQLLSLAISGAVVGEGSVQVYLEDESKLIYDSEKLKETGEKGILATLTGWVVGEKNKTLNVSASVQVVDEEVNELPVILYEEREKTIILPTESKLSRFEFVNPIGKLGLSETARGIIEPENVTFVQTYALDTVNLSFDKGEVFVTAQGDVLYSCPFWDFSLSICAGTWTKIKAVIPGKEYKLKLENGVIGYAEGVVKKKNKTNRTNNSEFNLKILDVAVKNFTLGSVAAFDVLLKNTAEKNLSEVSLAITLDGKKNTSSTTITSAQKAFISLQTQSLAVFWDTKNISAGTYQGTITLREGTKSEEKKIRLQVTKEEIKAEIVGITGKVIANPKPIQKLKELLFSKACADTCFLEGLKNTTYTLLIKVEDALLNLTKIDYVLQIDENRTKGNETNKTKPVPTDEDIPEIIIDKSKITFRDESRKEHDLKQYALNKGKEKGENWERVCEGRICHHQVFNYLKYYEKENGEFDLVKNALTNQGCEPSGAICVRGKKNSVFLKDKASENDTVVLGVNNDTWVFFEPLQLRHVHNGSQYVISAANPVTGKAKDNTFLYGEVFGKDTSMRFTYLGHLLKEEIIFKSNDFLTNITNKGEGSIFVDYAVRKTNNLEWADHLRKKNSSQIKASQLVLEDREGNSVFTFPQPIIVNNNVATRLEYILTDVSSLEVVSVEVPVKYFEDAAYPIILDPSITLNNSHIAFDGDVQFDPLGIGTPYTRDGTSVTFRVGDRINDGFGSGCEEASCNIRGEMDWDISSVPDNADLSVVNLTLNVLTVGSPVSTIFFHHMDGNSSDYTNDNTGNENFFADMGNGTNYLNQTVTATGFNEFILSASPTLISDLHSLLQSNVPMWSIGMRSNETGDLSAIPTAFVSEDETTSVEERPLLSLTYTLPIPSIILDSPENNTFFSHIINQTLNATVLDNEANIPEVIFYGDPFLPPRAESIIAMFFNEPNGTQFAANWTHPVTEAAGDTMLLLHFDNRSEFGENDTEVFDFSNQTNNGTVTVSGADSLVNLQFDHRGNDINMLGGAARFSNVNSTLSGNISLGDQDELIGNDYTYMVWVRPEYVDGDKGTIFTKLLFSAGMEMSQRGPDLEIISGNGITQTTENVSNFFTANTTTHVAFTMDSAGFLLVYKDGDLYKNTTIDTMGDNDADFQIGIQDDANDNIFRGWIDELVIYNRTLTDWQIKDAFRLKGDTYYWYVNATDESGPESGRNMSVIRELTINLLPEAILNSPANKSVFTTTQDIILNTTVIERELEEVTIHIFGSNSSTPGADELLFTDVALLNGTNVGYNFTSPVVKSSSGPYGLYHFDNRSEFGEDTGTFNDFSPRGSDATCNEGGGECPLFNRTGGKFGGGIQYDGINDYVLVTDDINFHNPPFSISVWFKLKQLPSEIGHDMYLVNVQDAFGPTFFSIWILYLIASGDFFGFAFINATNDDFTLHSDTTTTLTVDRWYHYVGTWNETNDTGLYINGQAVGESTNTGGILYSPGWGMSIGSLFSTLTQFNGTIDEVAFYNRTLSPSEVSDMYELKRGQYYWYANVTDNATNLDHHDISEIRTFFINTLPNVTNIFLDPDPANTTDTLTCNFTVVDLDVDEALSANITFFNGDTVFETYNITVTNGTEAAQSMTAQAQVRDENWKCSVIPHDNLNEGLQKNSTVVTIVNSVPSVPILLHPIDNNRTTNRTPGFEWTSSADADGDAITYTLNISCFSTSGGGCTAPGDNRLINTTVNTTGIAEELKFFHDDGFVYNWTVRAIDDGNNSAYAQEHALNITVLVAITLTTDFVDFGARTLGETIDTETGGSPFPFIIQNDGNSLIDVNLTQLGGSLFEKAPAPTDNYQGKIDNATGEEGAFNGTGSITTFAALPTSTAFAIRALNHTDTRDSAEIDINVTVPLDEPPGNKTTQLEFIGYYTGST